MSKIERDTKKRQIKKAAGSLKKTGFLCTDDLETIDYNNDTIINDLDDVEIINYNNDKNINDLDNVNLKKTLRAQIAGKNIVKKYKNLTRKRKRPVQVDLADLETVNYNDDTSISDLNNIPFGFSAPKKTKSAQIAARKIVQKYKKLSKKKSPLPFHVSDTANTETVDYNDDTNINDVSSNKGAQIVAKKIVKKYRNLARKKPCQRSPKETEDDVVFLKQVPVHPRDRLARKTKDHIKFVKRVPLRLQERLKQKGKTALDNYRGLSKKVKMPMSLS